MTWKISRSAVRVVERTLLILGRILLGVYPAVRLAGLVAAHAAVETFQAQSAARVPSPLAVVEAPHLVDTSLSHVAGTPLAVLKIPKIHLEVPVFEGTDNLTLDRGAGRIAGTAQPGEAGNLGIAGHRDGFFRGLKDIEQGDEIRLDLPGGESAYVVNSISVVTPEDVSVLRSTPTPSITLVTCFPFYFVGGAPRRYIVSALLREGHNPTQVERHGHTDGPG